MAVYKQWNEKQWTRALIAFVITTVLLFIYLLLFGSRHYQFDSQGYWDIAHSFLMDGSFKLHPPYFRMRGYTWPLILFLLNGAWHFPFSLYLFCLSAYYAVFMAVVAGNLFEEILHKKIGIVARILPSIGVMVFWPGVIIHALSDWSGALFSIASVYFLILLVRSKAIWKTVLFGFLAGFFIDSALNIRAPYKFNIYLAVLILVILCIKSGRGKVGQDPSLSGASGTGQTAPVSFRQRIRGSLKTLLPGLAGFLIGVFVTAAPQVRLNEINYGVRTIDNPLSYIEAQVKGVGDWSRFLVWEGLVMPRYETYAGDDETIDPRYMTEDPVMAPILEQEGIDLAKQDGRGYVRYVQLFFKYPVHFLAVYLSHLVNCMDTRYGEILIHEFGGTGRYVIQVLQVLLYTLALISMYLHAKKIRAANNGKFPYIKIVFSEIFLVVFFIAFAALVALPGHSDPRHALPAHMLLYFYLAFAPLGKELFAWIKKHWLAVLVLFFLLLSTLTLIQNYSLSFVEYEGLIF